jgi:galactoside O-acetyltransferase
MIFGTDKISLGSNVRVDAYTVISSQGGRVQIENNIHIATGVVIYGRGGVSLASGSGLAAGVKLISASDDYSDGFLTNPTMPEDLRAVSSAPVVLKEHAVVGMNSVILPGSNIGFGAAVGALTLVRGVVQDFHIVLGNPMRVVGQRDKEKLLEMHSEYLKAF